VYCWVLLQHSAFAPSFAEATAVELNCEVEKAIADGGALIPNPNDSPDWG